MRQEIKELHNLIQNKENELTNIKKSVKYTQNLENEVEKKVLNDEIIRLKHLAEQTLQIGLACMDQNNIDSKIQELVVEQSKFIKDLKLEGIQQSKCIIQLQEQSIEYKTRFADQEIKLKKEMNRLKSQNEELERNVQKLQDKISLSKTNKQLQQENYKLKKQNKLLNMQVTDLKRAQKNNFYSSSPIVNQNKQNYFTIKPVDQEHISPRDDTVQDDIQLFNVKKSMDMDYKPPLIQEQQTLGVSLQLDKTPLFKLGKLTQSEYRPMEQPVLQIERNKRFYKKRQKVQVQQIKETVELLKMRLQKQDIDIQQVYEYLIIENAQSMNQQDLTANLTEYPFNLNNMQADKLSRYLLEGEEETYENQPLEQSTVIIKSIIKNLLGSYEINKIKEETLKKKLYEKLINSKTIIMETLANVTITKENLKEELWNHFSYYLEDPELNFLIRESSMETESFSCLNKTAMFEFLNEKL